MLLKPEEREELVREAEAAGLDPAEVIAKAEAAPEPVPEEAGGEETAREEEATPKAGAAVKGVAPDGTRVVFAYNMVVLTVKQLREYMGWGDTPSPDDDLYVADFLAKRTGGGAPPGGTPPAGGEPA